MTDALIYIATLLACTLLLELLARRGMAQQERKPATLFIGRPALGYTLRPGFRGRANHGSKYRIKRYGFRDVDGDLTERPDGTRILALENAFAMGIGEPFDEPFLSLLESRLRETGEPAQIIKAGFAGYGTYHKLNFYGKFGRPLNPELVPLLYLLKGKSPRARALGQIGLVKRAYPQPLQLFATGPLPSLPDTARALRALTEFACVAHDEGQHLLLCVVPDKLQIEPDEFAHQIELLGFHPEGYDLDGPNQFLRRLDAANDVEIIDFTPAIRRLSNSGSPPFLDDDIRWSLEGRREAAGLAATTLSV